MSRVRALPPTVPRSWSPQPVDLDQVPRVRAVPLQVSARPRRVQPAAQRWPARPVLGRLVRSARVQAVRLARRVTEKTVRSEIVMAAVDPAPKHSHSAPRTRSPGQRRSGLESSCPGSGHVRAPRCQWNLRCDNDRFGRRRFLRDHHRAALEAGAIGRGAVPAVWDWGPGEVEEVVGVERSKVHAAVGAR